MELPHTLKTHQKHQKPLKINNTYHETSEFWNFKRQRTQEQIDAIGIQETHFGAFQHLQKEKGYIAYFTNETNNSITVFVF